MCMFFCTNFNAQTAVQYINAFIQKSHQINHSSFTLEYKERMNNKLKHSKVYIKLQKKPFKTYVKQDFPKKGLEILYVTEANNNKAWVNPGSFPWVTLSLSPFSSLMRAEGHFTIFESGFDYFAQIARSFLQHQDQLNFKIVKTVMIQGQKHLEIAIDVKDYQIQKHTIQHLTTLRKLSNKHKVAEYRIIELNPEFSSFSTSFKVGDQVRIPNFYAQKMSITLNVKTKLPSKVRVFDNQGLFQEYTFSNLNLAPNFSLQDFSSENKQYNF